MAGHTPFELIVHKGEIVYSDHDDHDFTWRVVHVHGEKAWLEHIGVGNPEYPNTVQPLNSLSRTRNY